MIVIHYIEKQEGYTKIGIF